jgi:hypothetical protein
VVPGRQEAYVGDSKLSPVSASTSVPPPPSLGETVRVEVPKVDLKEGSTSGVLTQEKTAEAPVLMEAAGANMTPRIDGDHANEVEPRPEDAPDGAALILGSPRGPGFSPPQGTASDNMMSTLGSLDIVDLGAGELGLPGCPTVPLLPAS